MNRENILIVEDDRTTAKIVKLQLEDMGYSDVSIARSAITAIKSIENNKPDLMLMDIKLGKGKDGIWTAEQINNKFKVPIIYLTAFADERVLARAKETNPLGFINKPLRKSDLRSTITIAVEQINTKKKLDRENQYGNARMKRLQFNCTSKGDLFKLDPEEKKKLKALDVKTAEELLPINNARNVATCLKTRKSQYFSGQLGKRLFSWEYFPTSDKNSVRITVTDITNFPSLSGSNIEQTALLETLDHIATCVILINENLKIYYTNKSADRLLESDRGLKRVNNYLNCSSSGKTSTLQKKVLDESDQTFTLSRGTNSKPLHMLITPLQAHKQNYGHDLPIAIIFAFDFIENPKRIEEVIRSLYNLTLSEARVAARLILTPDLAQVAKSLGIAHNTARTHLKRIYIKTNINRLSALVHMIVTGPVSIFLQSGE